VARASKASAADKSKATTKKTAAKQARSGGAAKATSKTTKKAAKKAATAKKAAKATTTASSSKAASSKSTAKKPATKSAAPAKSGRAKKSSHFDSKFLEKMRKLLNAERDTYERQAKQLRAEADSLVMDMDPGDVQFDEESGEGDSIAVERSLDLALSAQAQDAVDQIDAALDRIERGVYGICIISGEPIPKARLEFIPWAAEKVEYKVAKLGR
jgi:RNA polymerase-binding transcription factor DksA